MTDSEGVGGVPRLRPRGAGWEGCCWLSISWSISWSLKGDAYPLWFWLPKGEGVTDPWGRACLVLGGGNLAAWKAPPPAPGPAPDKPRSPALQRRPAEGGGTSLGGGSAFSPLPWQRARLVSLRSWRCGLDGFYGGAVAWGLRTTRRSPNRRGLAASGRWPQDALPGVERGLVWERAQRQEERNNPGGNSSCAWGCWLWVRLCDLRQVANSPRAATSQCGIVYKSALEEF